MIWLIAGLSFVLDQLLKFLFLHFLPYYTSVNSGTLTFNNTQAGIVTIIFILLLIGLFIRDRKLIISYSISSIGLGLVWGGSISNLIDRFSRNGVVDLGLGIVRTNLADLAVFAGLFLLFYFYFSRRMIEKS
ncbi:MAG: signal peptidase II [Patescibacteria group bacterium]|nr:signal peptidase II [Patescibacteria group bacterium]